MEIRPHDLIEISDLSLLKWNEGNEWAGPSLERTPFVVVRRAERPNQDYLLLEFGEIIAISVKLDTFIKMVLKTSLLLIG